MPARRSLNVKRNGVNRSDWTKKTKAVSRSNSDSQNNVMAEPNFAYLGEMGAVDH